MATANPFDLLGDDDNGDIPVFELVKDIPAAVKKVPQPRNNAKPLPGKEAGNGTTAGRTGGRGGRGRGQDSGYSNRGRGSYGGERFNRSGYNNNSANGYGGRGGFSEGGEDGVNKADDSEFGRSSERGGRSNGGRFRGHAAGRGYGRRSDYANGVEDGEPRGRHNGYDRQSGTGRRDVVKRDGAGRGNWGTEGDQEPVVEQGESSPAEEEKPAVTEGEQTVPATEETTAAEVEKKEEEDKEMTLDEYEKVLEEKRKALLAMKVEERKVDAKEFEAMQQLSVKKNNDDVFIMLGSEKDAAAKRREATEKEERARKPMNINEFLKPSEGTQFFSPGRGRGRGRGRGGRGAYGDGYNDRGNSRQGQATPLIADQNQFPSLGGK